MNALLIFSVFVLSFLTVHAQEVPILLGNAPQTQIHAAEIAKSVKPGQILVMGENHGVAASRQSQNELLSALRSEGLKVSVGLEFFYYPDQNYVDAYRSGQMDEASFLKQIQWGSPGFEFYRDQANFPRYEFGEKTLALNAPRTLTGKISKVGIAGLSAPELNLLPPQFQLGRDSYKKRFLEMMPHLPNPASGDNYFAAQSAWDDTMAWQASEFLAAHPDQVLAIVVGDFHAQYGGGLPDRLTARTGHRPVVFSFVNTDGLSQDEIRGQVMPSPEYGARGEFIWVTGPTKVEPSQTDVVHGAKSL
jgi:uncharacterized iron-regulated protein